MLKKTEINQCICNFQCMAKAIIPFYLMFCSHLPIMVENKRIMILDIKVTYLFLIEWKVTVIP